MCPYLPPARDVHRCSWPIQSLPLTVPTPPTNRINTWDYRRGAQAGWIPRSVSNTLQFGIPHLVGKSIAFE